jgi:diguanylate cyclase (GGDEF)-like protein
LVLVTANEAQEESMSRSSADPAEVAEVAEVHGAQSAEALTLEELHQENQRLRSLVYRLETLAYRDPLTGLRNRAYFSDRVVEEACLAGRGGYAFSLLFIDVNDLKSVNDTQGHDKGDLVLRRVAAFLERSIRQCDVCCRIGGDEFIVVLPGAGTRARECLVARLRRQLALEAEQAGLPVGLSMGGASCPADGSSARALLAQADLAMYEDKNRQKRGTTARGTPAHIDPRDGGHAA